MAKERKFTFSKIMFQKPIPEKEFVSLYKNGSLVIPRNVLNKHALDGKVIEFLYDGQKKALGFRKVEGNLHGNLTKSMKPIRQANGKAIIGIGKIMKHAGIEKKTYGQLPLDTYKDTGLIADDNEVLYFKLK